MADQEPTGRLKTILSEFGEDEKKLVSAIQSQMKSMPVPTPEEIRSITFQVLSRKSTPIKKFLVDLYDSDELKKIVLSLIQSPFYTTPTTPATSLYGIRGQRLHLVRARY